MYFHDFRGMYSIHIINIPFTYFGLLFSLVTHNFLENGLILFNFWHLQHGIAFRLSLQCYQSIFITFLQNNLIYKVYGHWYYVYKYVGPKNSSTGLLFRLIGLYSQYVEQKSNEHQKNMRNTITALKYVP